jgi:hypothetical protein
VASREATYERLRNEISALEDAATASDRFLTWATDDRSLALARDDAGRLEVFILGDRLVAATKVVAEVLEHQSWSADDGLVFPATRVVLPRGDHFDQLGATICVELVDHGLHTDAQAAFTAVEPLIALALTREVVTDLTLMGLIGELALLERLLDATAAEAAHDVLSTWAGSVPSARDFQIGTVGVEVKTTQGASSVHHVEGVHQVELGHSNDNVQETGLFMLSLGIGFVTDAEVGLSLPELTDSILGLVPNEEDRADLLARIKQYGGDAAIGYDHAQDRAKPRYASRFYFRFERLYDLCDDRLKLLTSARLAGLTNVDPGSVAFRVTFDEKIRGVHNPTAGWDAVTSRILREAGLGPGLTR